MSAAKPAPAPPPALLKLVAAMESTTPTNLFAAPARPMTSQAQFKVTRTKEQAEAEEGDQAGDDITFQTAMGIKTVLFGSRMFMIDPEWKNTYFMRQAVAGPFSYGLIIPKSKSRGLMVALQAQLIQIILSAEEVNSHTPPDAANVAAHLRLVYEWKQKRILIETMAKILWRAGEGKRAAVVLLYPAYAGLLSSEEKRLEHLMNTIKVIECVTFKQLYKVLEKRLDMFEHQDGGGALMFLYSLILSRTVPQLESDLQGDNLLTDTDECSLSLINLMLIGRATPYLFNGNQEYDLSGKPLDVVRFGIRERAEIGILVADKPEGNDATHFKQIKIGSMLKTPLFPIWVLRLKGRYSLFFCCNLSLNRDWRSEAKFTLTFYTGLREQKEDAKITVDSRRRSGAEKKRRDEKIPIVDECIQSRWPGALTDWNGTIPFF